MEHGKIATICGTMRLFGDMLTVADELTRQGYIVLMPFTRKSENSVTVHGRIAALEERDGRPYDRHGKHLNATPITGEELDRMHREKIAMADLVVVVTDFADCFMPSATHELYFGESTTAEMEYTRSLGKPMKLTRVHREDYRDTIVWLDVARRVGRCLMAADPAVEAAQRAWVAKHPDHWKPEERVPPLMIAAAREALASYRQRHRPIENPGGSPACDADCPCRRPNPICACSADWADWPIAWADCPDARDCYTEEELNDV